MSNEHSFTPEEIQKAREYPILQLMGISPRGVRVAIKCPFHKGGRERNPSCSVYPDNSFHCFTCEANGHNAVDFLMMMGATFREAIMELNK